MKLGYNAVPHKTRVHISKPEKQYIVFNIVANTSTFTSISENDSAKINCCTWFVVRYWFVRFLIFFSLSWFVPQYSQERLSLNMLRAIQHKLSKINFRLLVHSTPASLCKKPSYSLASPSAYLGSVPKSPSLQTSQWDLSRVTGPQVQ